jgi:hypothetical protein
MMKNKSNNNQEHFTGNVRLHVESAENYVQVNQLCLHLKTNNNIKISSYNWSEKEGLVISLSLNDSVPLGDILEQIPLVEQTYQNKNQEITVELNDVFPTTPTPALALSKEYIPV